MLSRVEIFEIFEFNALALEILEHKRGLSVSKNRI
jgi:hypothetical protein